MFLWVLSSCICLYVLFTSSLRSRNVHSTKPLVPLIALSYDHQNHSKWHKWCHIRYSIWPSTLFAYVNTNMKNHSFLCGNTPLVYTRLLIMYMTNWYIDARKGSICHRWELRRWILCCAYPRHHPLELRDSERDQFYYFSRPVPICTQQRKS